ncbi:hypothetical protein P3T76_015320 [Phytophthora citrophthora]|uniref:Uncharacterized protein n=1 Tax=Phytophthora citrophthora TaxID=4793 RepID=A0AAD9FZN4_9STRA|nr:hypothetical protein P3T76_015320 [Phytophthora citrophthora]
MASRSLGGRGHSTDGQPVFLGRPGYCLDPCHLHVVHWAKCQVISPKTLFSLPIVASIVGQIVMYYSFYAIPFALMTHQDSWYCPIADGLAYVNENATPVSGVDDQDVQL